MLHTLERKSKINLKPAAKNYKIENFLPSKETFNQIAKFLRFHEHFLCTLLFLFGSLSQSQSQSFFPSDLPQEVRKVLTISVLHFGIGCHMLLNATRTASKQASRQAGRTHSNSRSNSQSRRRWRRGHWAGHTRSWRLGLVIADAGLAQNTSWDFSYLL